MDRRLGQALEILGAGRAEVTLCRDVVSAAIGHDGRKEPLQYLGTCVLVMAVLGVVHREGTEFAGEMADVVQQRADDDFFGLAVADYMPKRLSSVFFRFQIVDN
jgi:hypothetical protein